MPADTQEAPVMPSAKELAAERKAAEKAKAERDTPTPRPDVPDHDRKVLDAATATLRDTGGEKWGAMRHVELLAMRKALERKAIAEGWKKHRPVLRKVAFGAARLTGEDNAEARAFLRDTFTAMSELAAKWKPKPWVCKTAGIRLAVLLTVDADGVTKEGKAKKPSGLRKLPPKPVAEPAKTPEKPKAEAKPADKPKRSRAKAKPKDDAEVKVSTRRSRTKAAEEKAAEMQPDPKEAEAAPGPPEPVETKPDTTPEPMEKEPEPDSITEPSKEDIADARAAPEAARESEPEPEKQDTEPQAS